MIPCLACGADDHETCGCWTLLPDEYEPLPESIDAYLQKLLLKPTEH